MVVHNDKFVITGSDDGGIRMWSVEGREQTLQFLVMNQVCAVCDTDCFSVDWISLRIFMFRFVL